MSLDPIVKNQIESLLQTHPVVLFMKGQRGAPRCGFSASSTSALDSIIDDYHTVDVLEDEEIRNGIKLFGNWPTIPQLYVKGELVGGNDIIQGMLNSGELHALFGVTAPDRTPPQISISDSAATAIREAMQDADGADLHMSIDANFAASFQLKPASGGEIASEANGIRILFDLASAPRAKGLKIDWAETATGAGLSVTNPNAPEAIPSITVHDLQTALNNNAITVVDVRPADARERAPFAGAKIIDGDNLQAVTSLPKDTALAFLCHHGVSSRAAAEHFRRLGFSNIANIEGGIDAWSREIDSSVPRY